MWLSTHRRPGMTQLAGKKIHLGVEKAGIYYLMHMWLMLLIRSGATAHLRPRRFFGKLPAHWIRIRSRLIIGIDLFRERIHISDLDLDFSPFCTVVRFLFFFLSVWADAPAYGIRVRSRQVRQPTGSLDHMSETNDAHVTRWRHASRGIAVLSADCSPNTSVAVVHSLFR